MAFLPGWAQCSWRRAAIEPTRWQAWSGQQDCQAHGCALWSWCLWDEVAFQAAEAVKCAKGMPSDMRPQHRRTDHMQVSAGRVTPVLLNGLQAGGGRRGRTPHELQMTAVPEHVPVGVLALKET